jgi:glycerate dehydrogenase
MKIVVLDGATLNPGDLSWSPLAALGACEIHERTAPPEVVPRAREAEIILTNKTPISAEALKQLPALRYIGVLATGHNVVDVTAARVRGIPVTNIPAYGTQSVAQHTIALLLELTNHVGLHARGVRDGAWARSPDFCYWERPLIELAGRTLAIVGPGRIGQAVARAGEGLGLQAVFATRAGGRSELLRVLRDANVISLHCPLTPETHEIINAGTLALMKPSALLLNTSRGQLIREADLAAALNAGRLAGAAVDVLATEPPPPDHPLLTARNCLITPHHAWATQAARARLMAIAVENLRAFLAGSPRNVVN